MPYVAIPTNLKNVTSINLQLMSQQDMTEMSYGEVLTAETINYRTGLPQMNGLFCQAIFGPTKDWECACGKYKRYRYAGVVCDKCGVEVTHSNVRRERMGHISLASPCVHPWFLRVIPSRIALLLDMKSTDLSRVTYFSSYVVTEIREDIRQDYLERIEKESENRVKQLKLDNEAKFEELNKEYNKSKDKNPEQKEALRIQFETNRDLLKNQQSDMVTKIQSIAEMAKAQVQELKLKDILPESVHQELASKYGPVFKAGIGAEAIEQLLAALDLPTEYENLKIKLAQSKGQTKKKLARRLNLIKHFLNNEAQPEWMILNRIMVLPPDLRPMLQLDGGRFAASDLNELYRRLINRNNRLRKLITIGAPEVILRNEKRMLQEAVEALIDNSVRGGKQVMASTGVKRPLKSLTDILKGKNGRFRQNLLGKRVDYSGRSVIIVGPSLKLDECGIPKQIAMELFKPFLMGRIISKSEASLLPEEDQCFNVHSARRLIETKKPIVYDILEEVIKDKYLLLNRAPTLHRLSFLAFKPVLVEGKAIQIHPLVCRAFNADFDGDQMAVHLPITIRGQEEARDLMLATKNLLKPASGEIIMSGGTLDIVLGSYYLTMLNEPKDRIKAYPNSNEVLMALDNSSLTIHDLIKVNIDGKLIETTPGRIIFNSCFPVSYKFINEILTKKVYEKTISDAYLSLGKDAMPMVLDNIKKLAYKYATQSGISLSAGDFIINDDKYQVLDESRTKVSQIQSSFQFGLTTNTERYRQVIAVWREASDIISKMTEKVMDTNNNVGLMIKSGAKGNISQLNLIAGIRGLSVTAAGNIIELPAQHGYLEGLTGLEYFISMKGQRKGQSDISLRTADAGYLTRRLVDVAQNVVITAEDCGSDEGIILSEADTQKYGKSLFSLEGRLYGRYLNKDVAIGGKTLAKNGDFVSFDLLKAIEEAGVVDVEVRTPTKCLLQRGVCQKCYGIDFSTHKTVELGVPVGIIAAQSLGENSTQLTMDQGKHGKGLLKSDITEGLGRVEEIFEVRNPKYKAPFLVADGEITKIEGVVDEGFRIVVKTQSTITLPYNASTDTLLVGENDEVGADNNLIQRSTGEVIRTNIAGFVTKESNQIVISSKIPAIEEFETMPGYYLRVKTNQFAKKGQLLTDGSADLQEILDKLGFDQLQEYITSQLIGIYSENGILVNEKHIEVIIRQMCSRVQIVEPGDTEFIVGDLIRYSIITNMNKGLIEEGKEPATFNRIITGISRASLITDSFLSAASFQEASKVLVEAVISGRSDNLLGLKENVILGQLIPAGTGFQQIDPTKDVQIDDAFVDEDVMEN
jgi:DNA-directed RNA polymerase subunit beta'